MLFDYPIKDKISVETYQMMLSLLDKTKSTGKEHGFSLCANKEITSGSICIGTECEIKIDVSCPHSGYVLGDFHTHPQSDAPPETDFPSNGDLISALCDKRHYRTNGTTCIAQAKTPDYVQCYSIKIPSTEDTLKGYIDEYWKVGHQRAEQKHLSHFYKETININEQLKTKSSLKK